MMPIPTTSEGVFFFLIRTGSQGQCRLHSPYELAEYLPVLDTVDAVPERTVELLAVMVAVGLVARYPK